MSYIFLNSTDPEAKHGIEPTMILLLVMEPNGEPGLHCEICQNLMQVALEDPKRFRIEMTFSRGADLSPLEVMQLRASQIA